MTRKEKRFICIATKKERKMIPDEVEQKYARIKKEEIPAFPGLLKYAHQRGSAIIKEDNTGSWREEAIHTMLAKASKELEKLREIKDGIEKIVSSRQEREELNTILKTQAFELVTKISYAHLLLHADLKHIPQANTSYHLYKKEKNNFLSLVGPEEWDKIPGQFICSAVYGRDNMFHLTRTNEKVFLAEIQAHLKK